jgi:O-antigen ligase
MGVVSRGKSRVYLLLLACVITIALILTQTRNTWISSTITLAVLAIYLMVRPELAELSRKRLLAGAAIVVLVVAVLGFVVVFLNPHVQERATELTGGKGGVVDQSGLTVTSLVSRYFIWDTARNAFLAHPYVGIGVYAFPYSSHQYSRLPEIWYTLYVEGNSPHQTQIAVLCETGLLGMAGYLVFMISALRVAFRTVRLAPDVEGRRYGFVAAIGVTYTFVSMAFTDAWLWGQGIVLLGLVMGLMLANRKIGLQEFQAALPREGS